MCGTLPCTASWPELLFGRRCSASHVRAPQSTSCSLVNSIVVCEPSKSAQLDALLVLVSIQPTNVLPATMCPSGCFAEPVCFCLLGSNHTTLHAENTADVPNARPVCRESLSSPMFIKSVESRSPSPCPQPVFAFANDRC